MAKKNTRSYARKKEVSAKKRYQGKYTNANSRRGNNAAKQRTAVIWVCTCVIVLGIALLAGCVYLFSRENGTIYPGVRVAGVDLGGMTKQEAETAIATATKNTYTQTNMVVSVLNDSVQIPAAFAGELDAAKAAQAAWQALCVPDSKPPPKLVSLGGAYSLHSVTSAAFSAASMAYIPSKGGAMR